MAEVRFGKCKDQCAECCSYFGTILKPPGKDVHADHIRAMHPSKIHHINGKDVFVMYCPCEALDLDTLKCTIYDKRPQICKVFPNSPDNLVYQLIKSDCGFTFQKEEEK